MLYINAKPYYYVLCSVTVMKQNMTLLCVLWLSWGSCSCCKCCGSGMSTPPVEKWLGIPRPCQSLSLCFKPLSSYKVSTMERPSAWNTSLQVAFLVLTVNNERCVKVKVKQYASRIKQIRKDCKIISCLHTVFPTFQVILYLCGYFLKESCWKYSLHIYIWFQQRALPLQWSCNK